MNKGEHLLTILGEEASELAVQCSKANRFGVDAQRDLPTSNRERLINEYNDILAVADMMNEEFGSFGFYRDPDRIAAKKAKVNEYMGYSRELGYLDSPDQDTSA